MTDDQNKFKTNYNTGGRPLTSTFQPPPRPGAPNEQPEPPEQPAIPSGKGGQTPWNSTRSARDWLGDSASTTETQPPKKTLPQIKLPSKLPDLPAKLPKLPKLPQMPKLALPKPKPKAETQEPPPPTRPKTASRAAQTQPDPRPQAQPNPWEQPAQIPAQPNPWEQPARPQQPSSLQTRTVTREQREQQVQREQREQRAQRVQRVQRVQTRPGRRLPKTFKLPWPKPKTSKVRNTNAPKQPKVISATIAGLICAAIVLLAECGLWGFYCYSHTLPGDTNVKASTFMYCFAVFVGNFWAGAVVRRRSLKPSVIICAVFLILSLVISLNLFSWREIKIKMVLLKVVLTLIAAAFGFILSLVPYLINKAIKKKRQEQAQRRQRQLERRQQLQQQYELERELAKRSRGRF